TRAEEDRAVIASLRWQERPRAPAPGEAGPRPAFSPLPLHGLLVYHPPDVRSGVPSHALSRFVLGPPPEGANWGRADVYGTRMTGRLTRRGVWRHALAWRYRLAQRHRHRHLVLEEVDGLPILVLPEVFNPKLFRSGEALARRLDASLVPPGCAVLDM